MWGFVILSVILVIFFNFYTLTGFRARRLMSKIPGYSEIGSLGLNLEASLTPNEGVKDYLGRVLGMYSSLCSMWFLGIPYITLISPDYIEVILKSAQQITKGYEYKIFTSWLGEGLLTSSGAQWHANRKMLTPAFHFRILESCLSTHNSNAQLLTRLLRENMVIDGILNVDKFISLCSLDIISEAAMGVKLDAQLLNHSSLSYVNAVRRMGELCLHRVKALYLKQEWLYRLTPNGREHKKLLNILHRFTENVIQESKKKRRTQLKETTDQRPASFVDFLLEMAENEPGLFTDVEIRQEVDTFMFEGHETTSSSISWTILLLGHNPDIQEIAYNELTSILGESDRHVSKSDLAKMTYLEAVIKESLRLYPPVSYMSRKLDSDMKIGGYTVPAGTNVAFMPYFLHRQSQLYPDPEKFDPERFINVENLKRHPFMYIPFSGGPRNCIGQRFAMMEMKVVVAHILRRFKIESVTKREGLKVLFSPILRPVNGIYVKLHLRE